GPDVAVGGDVGSLPDSAITEGDGGRPLKRIDRLSGEGERGAGRIVLDGQVGEIQTRPVDSDIPRIEIAKQKRADVPKTAVDQEALARIRRPPHDLDRLVM